MLPLFLYTSLPKEKVYHIVEGHESHIALPPAFTSRGKCSTSFKQRSLCLTRSAEPLSAAARMIPTVTRNQRFISILLPPIVT